MVMMITMMMNNDAVLFMFHSLNVIN